MDNFSQYLSSSELRHEDRPYFPFIVALEKGILPPSEIVTEELKIPPAIDVLNGHIPNYKHAGCIAINDHFAAFDLSNGFIRENNLVITPGSKDSVDHEGNICGEGVITLMDESGRLKVVGISLDPNRHFWTIENLRRRHRVSSTLGAMTVIPAGFDLPDFEVTDIQPTEGILISTPRKRYF
ncbi:MAG: hypothetical protein NVSMB46_07220 [Candidatus Saccharimonadales bacterium]